ncbi:ATP synthase gamma chain [Bacteroides coprosuis DSM 18011]|uniref:ATP synthase gamma chain n=1 Tax=Bacteroides coprosuis DSM 18011 TaxID=679937 RepID=F3ZUT2_9BACE|nr:F0F1 ATP synthase subunit gamma [Bacteroides coprosuis]EGJ71392.1 ATP synthase gamma chain [Bacteroides coprosuis DSM 18011]
MGSLREVKNRINSVKNTRKITSAMRMVASAKLTKVEGVIENMLPYQNKLDSILCKFLSGGTKVESPFTVQREVKRIAVVVMSSNTSLCGAYNANVIRSLTSLLEEKKYLGEEAILLYPIGRKVEEFLKKNGYQTEGSFQELAETPSYKEARKLANILMKKFLIGEIDQVVFIYHHFKSLASQELLKDVYLPLDIDKYRQRGDDNKVNNDYIVEPSEVELIANLLPKVLSQKLFTVLVDSNASEHAARSLAMQIATDNANELIQELTKQYNKSRQQAITNELLDIIGGSMR